MPTPRRWLQFSLRGFLAVVTIVCLWLGWKAENARKRGQAIDAILKAGGSVQYGEHGEDLFIGPYTEVPNHFWLDLLGVPAMVILDSGSGHFGAYETHLSNVSGLEHLHIQRGPADDEVRRLYGIQGKCTIEFGAFCNPSDSALKELQEALPEAKIVWVEGW
jgi:hypothetical protein